METRSEAGATLRSGINVTPLVDVCLVLLIIFMVVAPYLVPGRPVALPEARNPSDQPDSPGAVTLTLEADGAIYWRDDPVSPEGLGALLRDRMERAPGTTVRVRADRRLDFGSVKTVLQALQAAGCKGAGLAVMHVDERGLPVSAPAVAAQEG